ncbi:hypothetical protein ACIQUQ_04610 [Streptomyces sp. NPDC101118]|uniref:hypothetical protein n=1 Tax=Streptomyces sp. NPDC101118 TaxID=3366109 RepID=UPI00380FADAB
MPEGGLRRESHVLPDDGRLDDAERCRVPVEHGTSHAVFVGADVAAGTAGDPGLPVPPRFFTSAGELPACGHGTVAAPAWPARRTGGEGRRSFRLRASGRDFDGWTVRAGARVTTSFDPGPVRLPAPHRSSSSQSSTSQPSSGSGWT